MPDINKQKRLLMIKELETEGIKNKEILEAMGKIPRHEFLPEELEDEAYLNIPLPVGHEQTISQPYTIAFMLEALELEEGNKVLEIGTASGYNACLIAEIIGKKGKVYTIEIVPELVKTAKQNIKKAEMKNIVVVGGDGSSGYERAKPYDRIIITAAAPLIPEPLIKQLKGNGILVGPVGNSGVQSMIKIVKTQKGLLKKELGSFVFVPMRGKYGHK